MSKADGADAGEQWTLDEATSKKQQRRAALQGGARYGRRPTTSDDQERNINTSCQNCDGHVSRRYVRVNGVNGTVHACPGCADTSALLNGAAAGRERRETL